MVALYTISLFMHLFCNGHAFLFLQSVTVVCTSDLCLAFPNYARVVICDDLPNVIHTTVTDLNCVPIENFV